MPIHQNSLKNLVKGHNPYNAGKGGRPPKTAKAGFNTLLDKKIKDIYKEDKEVLKFSRQFKVTTLRELMHARIVDSAVLGKLTASREVMDRTDGTPQHHVEVTGDADNPIEIRTRAMLEDFSKILNSAAVRKLNSDVKS
jgi:hypothetical protein